MSAGDGGPTPWRHRKEVGRERRLARLQGHSRVAREKKQPRVTRAREEEAREKVARERRGWQGKDCKGVEEEGPHGKGEGGKGSRRRRRQARETREEPRVVEKKVRGKDWRSGCKTMGHPGNRVNAMSQEGWMG